MAAGLEEMLQQNRGRECIHVLKLLFRPKIFHEPHLDVFTVNVAIKIEDMQFYQSLRLC